MDAGSIANKEDFIRQIKPCRGWFHPGDGIDKNGNPYHADWYHHVMPLYKRDGEEIDDWSHTCTRRLNPDEVTEYLEILSPGESIITELPGGIILTLSGHKTREVIEKYAVPRLVFDVGGPRTDESVLLSINVKEVIDSEVHSVAYDGQSMITPIFEYATKEGADSKGILFVPTILLHSIAKTEHYTGKETLDKLAKGAQDMGLKNWLALASASGGRMTISYVNQDVLSAFKNHNTERIEMPIDPFAFCFYLPRLGKEDGRVFHDLSIYCGRKVDEQTTVRQ